MNTIYQMGHSHYHSPRCIMVERSRGHGTHITPLEPISSTVILGTGDMIVCPESTEWTLVTKCRTLNGKLNSCPRAGCRWPCWGKVWSKKQWYQCAYVQLFLLALVKQDSFQLGGVVAREAVVANTYVATVHITLRWTYFLWTIFYVYICLDSLIA
jgi:hypothetical protein